MVTMPTPRRRLCAAPSLLLLSALLATPAQAQSSSPVRADPLNPRAEVPALRYEPAFATFRRSGNDKPVAWREANDLVARIGGWRTYAREAQQPDAAAAAVPVPAPARASTPASAPAAVSGPAPSAPSGHKH